VKNKTLLPHTRSFARPLALGLALLGASHLAAATVEERLAELEKQTAALAAENAVLKKELGYSADGKAPVFVLPAGKVKKVVLGGFVQGNAEFGDAPDTRWGTDDDRFLLRRARLNLTATLANDFTAKIEADFGANSLNTGAGSRGQLTDGYIQWSKYDAANVRIGQFKTPFGYEQLISDTKLLTIERALPNDRLTVSRQIGVAVMGDIVEKRLSYSVGAFNGNGVNTGQNDNENFMWAGRVSGQAYEGTIAGQPVKLTGGINAFTAQNDAPSNRKVGYGMDVQAVSGPLTLLAEWLRNENDALAEAAGWSMLAAWRFNDNWRGLVRYETYDGDTAIANTTTDVWTLGVDYLFKGDDLKFSLNYLLGEQPEPADDGGRLIARMQVVF
jgi:phosphate-selective porin